jgi:hypothetical protein
MRYAADHRVRARRETRLSIVTRRKTGGEWPYSLLETLVFVVLVAATVELGNTFGFFYGLAFGIGAGAIAGLINK